ncbi:MAG: rane protein [Gaiellaceae bacterium]|jgi:membrane protein|nr:rane protein [Gaiellaceae bacterium]
MARTSRGKHGRKQSFKELVSLWTRLSKEHALFMYAGVIAFEALIALVALALLGLAVLGEIGRTDVWDQQIGPQIAPKVLPAVYAGLDATVQKIFHSSSAGLIAFASVLTIWQMSGVVRVCMAALARIYGDKDDRSWKIRSLLSIGIGFVLTLALVGAVLLATAAKSAAHGSWGVPFAIVRWLLTIGLIAAAFGVLVRFAPPKPRTTRWASGGATVVVIAWVAQSLLFAVYLRTFADYKTSVGALLGIYFVTTYLYVAAAILLIGMELDEQLRKDVQGKQERGIVEIVRDVI